MHESEDEGIPGTLYRIPTEFVPRSSQLFISGHSPHTYIRLVFITSVYTYGNYFGAKHGLLVDNRGG